MIIHVYAENENGDLRYLDKVACDSVSRALEMYEDDCNEFEIPVAAIETQNS
jgi:hypothetical protein